jgi:thioredoxin
MTKAVHADDQESFEREVLHATDPVVVDFWAEWCGPCRLVGPELEALAQHYAGAIKVVKVNVDAAPQLAGRYGVQGIPTLVLFQDGEPTRTLVGARPRRDIDAGLGLADLARHRTAATGHPAAGADGRYCDAIHRTTRAPAHA